MNKIETSFLNAGTYSSEMKRLLLPSERVQKIWFKKEFWVPGSKIRELVEEIMHSVLSTVKEWTPELLEFHSKLYTNKGIRARRRDRQAVTLDLPNIFQT
jgi:hypothetical protein